MDNYAITIYWSDEDQVYIAEVPELPGCITHGETQIAALANANEAIQLWIDTAKEFGNCIPEPKGQRLSVIFVEPNARRAGMTANSFARSAGGSSVRRNRSRIFSSLRAPLSTTNPKAH
jgi:predicted RNase H-like HicB family nuclease